MRRDERCLVVVADRGQARLYTIEANDATRRGSALVERVELANPDPRSLGSSVPGRPRTETNTNRQAGPVHPMGAQRERHRLELHRRFAAEIAASAAKLTSTWPRGAVVLIAEPGLLGLAREFMRDAVDPRVDVKELARDYAHLTRAELHEQLIAGGLLPEARGRAR